MTDIPEKLTTGDPLSVDELLEYLPALKEVHPAQLKANALGAAVRRVFRAGEIVCEEGTFGSTAFYIVAGAVDIYIANPLAHVRTKPKGHGLTSFFKKMSSVLARREGESAGAVDEGGFIPIDASVDLPRSTPIAYLGKGELFGEMTCRTFQPRSATVRATEDCIMVEMLRVILDMLVGTRDPDAATKASTKVRAATFKGTSFRKQLDDQYRERSLLAHLRAVPLFATLDLEFFNRLREGAELISCNKGQVICKQGDPADAFYLIRTGLVRVAQAMPGGEMVRTYLKRGEYFGETGLLLEQARNATCSALDAVDLVKISKEDFTAMLDKFPIVRATVEKVAEARLVHAIERKLPAGLQLDEFLNQGLFEAQNLLLIDLDHCTRCDACVNACADAHDGITRLIRDGLRYDRYLVATACRSCRDPLCMTQCPVGSIRRKESLEIIIEDWCIGCQKCSELCPYGNINMQTFEVKKEVPATEPKAATPAKAPPAAGAKPAAPAAGAAAKAAPAPGPAKPMSEAAKSAPSPAAAAAPATAPAPAKPTPSGANPSAVEIPIVSLTDPSLPAPEAARGSKPEAVAAVSTGSGPETQAIANAKSGPPPSGPSPEHAGKAAEKPPVTSSVPAAPAKQGSEKPIPSAAEKPFDPEATLRAVPEKPAAAPTPTNQPASPPSAAPPPQSPAPAAPPPAPATPAAPAPKPSAPTPQPAAAKPAAPPAAPAAKPAAAAAAAAPPKKMVKKKVPVLKATTCDLCTQLSVPSCVYACPHDAAMRVDPTKFLAAQIGAREGKQKRRFSWFLRRTEDRTTHE